MEGKTDDTIYTSWLNSFTISWRCDVGEFDVHLTPNILYTVEPGNAFSIQKYIWPPPSADGYCIWWYKVLIYNMVGVAVAMVISTMHEKSCIDSHNARKFEKRSKI